MIDHTGIPVSDWEKSKAFYDAVFAAIGAKLLYVVPKEFTDGRNVGGYGRDKPDFWLHESKEVGLGRHTAFTANNRAEVDAFYAAGLNAGGKDNGAPGLRPQYHADYYGAFLFDPDGNNIEAVCHRPE
ncbi:VOC family protein [Aliihoeflea aestuarii]|jgi:catechol 2,3-dioxygenase-like lactoylglutathione lyase family enzyme|uniref:VOC family protein n=1 Tax=Aliihoeflea aestuarii TaxID=453840 RepID=UPI0020944EC9|nr:VOC family protein [Aliihoeflea aestuarii]MCO6392795.1 VOC family protein [Aliihoeflea aestuarii]